ncbi:MAG: hypothetical protein K6B75_00065 [Lachnospiraceae bacterium]|nr:hypothetical protein [Lachnospiraceae bacterium]
MGENKPAFIPVQLVKYNSKDYVVIGIGRTLPGAAKEEYTYDLICLLNGKDILRGVGESAIIEEMKLAG